jgi:hypothetical protein
MTSGRFERPPAPLPEPALEVLRRIASSRTPEPGERCEMCAEAIGEPHQHVVNLHSRALMCTCRACYLLFTDQKAALRYRSVPDRYLSFPEFRLERLLWNELQIPVGLAFLFANSMLERTVAFYPGPAGATESELPMTAWEAIVAANPQLSLLAPDVEALLIRAPDGRTEAVDSGAPDFDCHLVPVDACYELVGLLRRSWRGFDGGQDARAVMADFFAMLAKRSRVAPAVAAGGRR